MTTRLAAAALAAALLAAACGSTAPAASPAPPTPGASPAALPAATPPVAIPSIPAVPSAAAAACTLPAGAAPPVLDASLMAVLPASVAGVAVTQEPDVLSQAVADPCFVANIDGAAFPIAVSADDLASGVLAHLRAGVYSDAFFSDWRATYNDGACAQSSGVLAEADQTIGGRTIYVATCGGGLRVYHAYLAGEGVIVSLLSTGPNGFGEQLMAGLRG